MSVHKEEIIVRKKSDMNAQNSFDYKRISYSQERFLDCGIEEEEEDLKITYAIGKNECFTNIRKEKMEVRIVLLLDAIRLLALKSEYSFWLSPENLYYDVNHRVYVMQRDVYQRGESEKKEEGMLEIKALIGFALQKKYNFHNYYEGGIELLQKEEFLRTIYTAQTEQDVITALEDRYEKIIEEKRQTKAEVNKGSYLRARIISYVSTILLICAVIGTIYYYQSQYVCNAAIMEADNRYIANDAVGIIDTLETIEPNQLNQSHKYILAQAYVKGENLSAEQKENILSTLNVNSEEKRMEYWIYLGRLQVEEAENIAMQYSDDELLLYAYLKDKSMTENDTTISGDEKTAKLADLETKIEKIAKKYDVE